MAKARAAMFEVKGPELNFIDQKVKDMFDDFDEEDEGSLDHEARPSRRDASTTQTDLSG